MSDGTCERAAVKRQWSHETKLRIVAESRAAGARVGEVAARYGLSPSLLSTWRGQLSEAPMPGSASAGFVAVRLIEAALPAEEQPTSLALDAAENRWLRITLPDGTRLHIGHAAHLALLRGVLGVLRG